MSSKSPSRSRYSPQPQPPDPIYQISNDQSYQEVGRPGLLNSLRNKYQGAGGETTLGLPPPPPHRPHTLERERERERVLVPNLKPKPADRLTDSQNLYSEVSHTVTVNQKAVFQYSMIMNS